MGVRKSSRSLTDDEKKRFTEALDEVNAAGLQGVIAEFARLHKSLFDLGIHRSSHFLPWHREFVVRFERRLQAVDASVSIPYWDASSDQNPSDLLFWGNNYLKRFDAEWGLGRRFLVGRVELAGTSRVEGNQGRNDYVSFRTELEDVIHNPCHNWIGGAVTGTDSPLDPAFFLIHAWIDLLWARWQRAHPNAPFVSSGTGRGLTDPMPGWADRTPASVLNHRALGYSYDIEGDSLDQDVGSRVKNTQDGRLEVFVRQRNGQVHHIWQIAPSGGWSSWASLGGTQGGIPVVIRNVDGRLEVFTRSSDDNGLIHHIWQTAPNNGWSSWESLGGQRGRGTPAVALNANGRVEVFGRVEADDQLRHAWQTTPGGTWSSWESLGGALAGDPVVAQNTDGRLEVFARGTDGLIHRIWQTAPSDGWSQWESIGGPMGGAPDAPVIGRNLDGRLEVFTRDHQGKLHHRWQTAPGNGWSDWHTRGGPLSWNPAVFLNRDGRMEVFARLTDGLVRHIRQTTPNNGWSADEPLGGPQHGGDMVPARNADGRMELFTSDSTSQALHHIRQTTPNNGWSTWESLGGPSPLHW